MSKWADVGKAVAGKLPVIGAALGGPAGAAVGAMVAGALGVRPDPDAVTSVLADPGAFERLKTLEYTHAHEIEKAYLAANVEGQRQVSETYRAELSSDDPYVRRARPGFVYALKWTWIVQVSATWATAFLGVFGDVLDLGRVDAGEVMQGLAQMNADTMMLWGPALAVIGVYNYVRSNDKAIEAGHAPTSIFDRFRRG